MAAHQGVFHINLLPKDSFSFSPLGKFLSWATTTGRVLVVLTEFVVLLAFGSRFYFDKRVNDLTEEFEQKQIQIEAYVEVENTIRRYLAKQQPVANFLESNLFFSRRYNELSSLMPNGVTLEKLEIDDTGIEMTGQSSTELGFAQLLRNLKNMQGVSRLSMKETSFDQGTGTVKFNIQTIFE